MADVKTIPSPEVTDPRPAPEPTHAQLLDRARDIARFAQERAGTTERERRVSSELIAAFKDADLTRVVQPAAWGGMQRSASEFYELAYEIGRGCGSAGWSYCVLAGHAAAMLDFPESAQAAVWRDEPDAMISSAFAPTLKAKREEGGYRIEGASPFSSGCDHASWALLGGMLTGGTGEPERKLFLVPRSDYEIVDDWHVLGLEGSGSKALGLNNVFVPADRVIDMPDFFAGLAPLGLQAVMVGTARGGIDSFVEALAPQARKVRCATAGRVGTLSVGRWRGGWRCHVRVGTASKDRARRRSAPDARGGAVAATGRP